MTDIIKVMIKGSSGYCCSDEAYTDKVTVTPDSIDYEYKPECESGTNPKRKWTYQTTSPVFQMLYKRMEAMTSAVLRTSEDEVFCTDVGGIDFTVTYADKTEQNKQYFCTGDEFIEYFAVIKQMVPGCEYVPAVLLTSEDYKGK